MGSYSDDTHKFLSLYSKLSAKLSLFRARFEALLDEEGEVQVIQYDDEKTLLESIVYAFEGNPAFPTSDRLPTAATGDEVAVDEGLGTVSGVSTDGVVTVKLVSGRTVKLQKDAVRRRDGEQTVIAELLGELVQLEPETETEMFQQQKDALSELWETVQNLYKRLKSAVLEVVEYREGVSNQIQNIMADQKKMHDWAVEQVSKLEAVKGNMPGMKRMCNSLKSSRAQAEKSVAVVLESAQQHVPDPLIESAIKELLEVWRNLQVELYDQTLHVIDQEHKASGLSEALKNYSQVGKKVLPLLQNILDESGGEGKGAEECKKLMSDWRPHQLIVEHLAAFETRQEEVANHYKYLRTTVTSQLTQLCQQLGGSQLAYKDRQRYERRVEDLRMWLHKTASEPREWQDAQQRLADIQALAVGSA